MFGIITYKTQRIEIAMIMHMLLNFDYSIRTYWVNQGYTSVINQLVLASLVAWSCYQQRTSYGTVLK